MKQRHYKSYTQPLQIEQLHSITTTILPEIMATASIHSCLHVWPSPTWVLLTIWGLLYISMTTAVPLEQPAHSDSSNETEIVALKHLMQGMQMVWVTIGPNFAQGQIRREVRNYKLNVLVLSLRSVASCESHAATTILLRGTA